MKVYIVTTGEYSDYTIEGVFSTEAKAQEAVDRYDDAQIEEHEMDGLDTSQRVEMFHCWLDDNGNLSSSRSSWLDEKPANSRGGKKGDYSTKFRGWSTRSAEDARRLAAEARTRHLQEAP